MDRLLVLLQSDKDGYYGHGIHGRTRKKSFKVFIFLCSSVDSVAIKEIWYPVWCCSAYVVISLQQYHGESGLFALQDGVNSLRGMFQLPHTLP